MFGAKGNPDCMVTMLPTHHPFRILAAKPCDLMFGSKTKDVKAQVVWLVGARRTFVIDREDRVNATGRAWGVYAAVIRVLLRLSVSRLCEWVYAAWNCSPCVTRLVSSACRELYQESAPVVYIVSPPQLGFTAGSGSVRDLEWGRPMPWPIKDREQKAHAIVRIWPPKFKPVRSREWNIPVKLPGCPEVPSTACADDRERAIPPGN